MQVLLVWWIVFGFTAYMVPRVDRLGDSFGLAYGDTLKTAYHAVGYAFKKVTLLAVLGFAILSFCLAVFYTLAYFGA